MNNRILITGGAGFIGSALCVRLTDQGYSVRVLDNLSPQIHGSDPELSYTYKLIKERVEFILGDVRSSDDWKPALKNIDCVIHLAAETGTGQSMYEIERYVNTNVLGTAIFLDLLVNTPNEVQKVIIASSRAIYGEGKYYCNEHGFVYPEARDEKDLLKGDFECKCPLCRETVNVRATGEESAVKPSSVYAITKFNQEQLVLSTCRSLGITAFAFRYQNVYGPGQSLKNPYTGILSVFTNLIRQNQLINIFEDGQESRDFVFIDDVIDATCKGISSTSTVHGVYNVGSGIRTSVNDVITELSKAFGISPRSYISGSFRKGDIRHCFADISKIKNDLEFTPEVNFQSGVTKYSEWALKEKISGNNYLESLDKMKQKGLFR